MKNGAQTEENTAEFYAKFLLYKTAALIKDNNFYEEEEVRFIAICSNIIGSYSVHFYISGDKLVPYIKMKFKLGAIKKIIIGPQLHQEKNFKSVQLLLDKYDMNYKMIKKSKIPFIGW